MATRKGFTLIELMVVVLIVGILAAASIPLMRGRIDSAKWAEANATAGTIKSAVRVYYAEHSGSGSLTGTTLDNSTTLSALGFVEGDISGTYFAASDYAITSVDTAGNAVITVTPGGSKTNAPSGKKQLTAAGEWVSVSTSD